MGNGTDVEIVWASFHCKDFHFALLKYKKELGQLHAIVSTVRSG